MKYVTILFCIVVSALSVNATVLTDVETSFASNNWSGGFTASMTLTNNSKSTVSGWYVEFDFPNEIKQVWNAELVSKDGSHYIVKNKDHNAIIKSKRSVTFSFSGSPEVSSQPTNVVVHDIIDVDPGKVDCEVTFRVDSDWTKAFEALMTIKNNGDEITGWVLEFDMEHEITRLWDGVLESVEKDGKVYHYKVKNKDYNAIIKAGQQITFGFIAKPGGNVKPPFNIKINGKDPSGGDTDNSVVLVYKTLARTYVHRRIGNDWKYEGDEKSLTYYDVVEFNTETRDYKQAKRVVVNYDGSVSETDGLDFAEYAKEPRDGETEPYMKYVVGSHFETDNSKFGSGEALYGKVVLAQKANIGWKEKVAVARSMNGKFNLDSKSTWMNYNYYTRLESKYTKHANENDLSVDQAVKYIIDEVKK